jgi:transcriptional regulator with XRE-family HTH domain
MTGPELRALRQRLGLTQAQCAERLGLSLNTVARYEMPSNQGRFPVPETVAQLMRMWVEGEEKS